ncbi:phosphatidate cytidylyltransferase [Lucifera butyrica]|nr:phosphatidate cytidylyltransferase [Lucifera butyrica]
MLVKRVFTAAVGIPFAMYVINLGDWPFFLTVLALASLAWYEFTAMLRHKNIDLPYGMGIAGIILLLACAWWGNPAEIQTIILLSVLITFMRIIFAGVKFSVVHAAFMIMGILYVGLTFSYLLLLRSIDSGYITTLWGKLPAGAAYLWLPFIGTWASDSMAYLVGSQWGKHKLCPNISPGKTVEGVLGGVVGSIMAVAGITYLFQISTFHGIIIGGLVGIIAPLGDLAESAIKRFTGVKDSGRLLPGHGGVLDRFDSILFVVPFVYYYTYYFMLR